MAIIGNCYEYVDRCFYDLTVPIAEVEQLYDGCRWAEGPVWFNDGDYLLWSDIPNQRLMRWMPDLGVSVYRSQTNYINGNTRDRQGRLVSCCHGDRNVQRTEPDGSITVIAESHGGNRLNSPNDVVVKSDDSIWFSDPSYGILSDYEGYKSEQKQAGCYVYRTDGETGAVTAMVTDMVKPNGLAFSPDESVLYVADSGITHDPDGPHHIRAYDVAADGKDVSNSRVVTDVEPGFPDGFRIDVEGNIWTSAQDGVHCYSPDGNLLGKIRIPETVSNLTFGGPRRNRLFITANKSLYAVFVGTKGVQTP